MKTVLLFIFVLLTAQMPAQMKSSAIKLGHFSPAAASGGFIIGYEGGMLADEMINLSWSIDWFHQNYTDRKLVDDYNRIYGVPGSSINELRAKTNIHDVPAMLSLSLKYPVSYLTKVFVSGGIGAEVLFVSYKNFVDPDEDEFQTAFDLNWRLGIGALYELGSSSEIMLEIMYHSSEPGWEYEIRDAASGIDKTYERTFDMSGVIARMGFKFYY